MTRSVQNVTFCICICINTVLSTHHEKTVKYSNVLCTLTNHRHFMIYFPHYYFIFAVPNLPITHVICVMMHA